MHTQGGDAMGGTGIPERGMLGNRKGGVGPRPCLLCSVPVAMEEEEEQSPSSSEEETEEEETVTLDSDTEQVSRRNLATYSTEASTHPPNMPHGPPQEKPIECPLL